MVPGLSSLEKLGITGGHAKSSGKFDTNINYGDFSVGGKSDYSTIIKLSAVSVVGYLVYIHLIKPKRKAKK